MNCNHIRFFGGGRWATIVLTELVKNFPKLTIDWVCQSNLIKKYKIIDNSKIYKNVFLVNAKDIDTLIQPDKIIIASHSSQHCLDFMEYKDNAIDVLIEKPLFQSFNTFKSLSDQRQKNVFLNLEFYNAYFIEDFYHEIKLTSFKKIDIFWHDPLSEKRASEEEKYSEIYSSIFMDQLLHVMSILKKLGLDTVRYSNTKVKFDNLTNSNSIKIQYDLHGIKMSISLSRFATIRERKIILNDGAAELDFSEKPNYFENEKFKKELLPSDRIFPIAQTLKNYINHPKSMSTLSLQSLMPEIKFCFECEDAYTKIISDKLVIDTFNPDNITPDLFYYAGIMYYRMLPDQSPLKNIHFLKGEMGLSELGHWLAYYLEINLK